MPACCSSGSVISAMGGEQSLDKMGGFRKAMPFTFITFSIGALALAAFPLTSGFFSKDEILAFTMNRGGWYVALGVVGYIAAFMTAFYSFRMVFRVFFGKAVPEAEMLERGELAHGDHRNPSTGEEEDTEVGFPGPDHWIAERAWPMRAAMAPLGVLALVAGVVGIPGLTDTLEHFLEPVFEDSSYAEVHPSDGAEWVGLAVGAAIGLAGIALAYLIYMRRSGVTARLVARMPRVHDLLAHKYYFDEIYDAMFVRPGAALGRFGRTVIESEFVQGVMIGGPTGVVRAGTNFARAIQSGYLRAYAGLLLFGLGGLVLYFLIVSS